MLNKKSPQKKLAVRFWLRHFLVLSTLKTLRKLAMALERSSGPPRLVDGGLPAQLPEASQLVEVMVGTVPHPLPVIAGWSSTTRGCHGDAYDLWATLRLESYLRPERDLCQLPRLAGLSSARFRTWWQTRRVPSGTDVWSFRSRLKSQLPSP
jgi:hypothetical protein